MRNSKNNRIRISVNKYSNLKSKSNSFSRREIDKLNYQIDSRKKRRKLGLQEAEISLRVKFFLSNNMKKNLKERRLSYGISDSSFKTLEIVQNQKLIQMLLGLGRSLQMIKRGRKKRQRRKSRKRGIIVRGNYHLIDQVYLMKRANHRQLQLNHLACNFLPKKMSLKISL